MRKGILALVAALGVPLAAAAQTIPVGGIYQRLIPAITGAGVEHEAILNAPIIRVATLPSMFTVDDVGKRYQVISTGRQYVVVDQLGTYLAVLVDGDMTAANKADRDLQNVSTTLSASEQATVLGRIGAQPADPSGASQIGVNDLDGSDRLLFDDVSDNPRRVNYMTVANFGTHLAGDNTISSNSEGELTVGATIARDSELPNAVDLGISGNDLSISITRPGRSALTDTVTLPAGGGGMADGVVSGGSYASETLTLTRTNSLADVTISGFFSGRYDDLLDRPVLRVGNLNSIPQPSAATNGRRYQTGDGRLWRVEDVYVAGVDRVVDIDTMFPTDTTSASGVRFQGAVDHFSDLPGSLVNADDGKWWFIRSAIQTGGAPFISVSGGGFQSIAHSPDADHSYVGAFSTKEGARLSHEVTAAGQLVIYPVNGTYDVYEVAAGFVAGTPGHHTYEIRQQDVDQLLLARISNLEARPALNDGVVTAGTVSGTTLTLERSVGDDVTITGLPTGGGDAFDLWDDVTRSETLLGGTDRFLFGDDSAAGDPNTYITFSNLSNQVRPDWRNEGVSVTTSPQFINCVGVGIDCTLNGSEVRIGVTANGDITSVATPTTGGLTGGATSGDVTLSLNIPGLASFTGSTLHRADQLIIRDDSDTVQKRLPLEELLSGIAGTNLTISADGTQLNATGGTAATTFVALTDTPDSIEASQCVRGNAAADALEFAACATGTAIPITKTTAMIAVRTYGTTYEVAGTILESNSSNTSAHGLGQEPDGFEMYLENTTADKGYEVGDKVYVNPPPPWRETIAFDDTNIYVYTKNQAWGIINEDSTTGDSGNFDLSDWKLVIRPYAYADQEVVTDVSGAGTGDIEGVTAGRGLTGGGDSGTVTVALDIDDLSGDLSSGVASGDILAFADVSDPNDRTEGITVSSFLGTIDGTGLAASGNQLSIATAYRLPASPTTNHIAQWNGSAWVGIALPVPPASRLLPLNPGDDQIAQYDATTMLWEAVNLPSGGTTTPLSSATPAEVDTTDEAVGTATAAARGDHVHELASAVTTRLLPMANSIGQVPRWGGTTWGLTTIPSLSNGTPFTVEAGQASASAGTNSNVSRSDHKHQLSAATAARLLPTSPDDDQIAQYNSTTSAWEAVDPPTGGGTGDITSITEGPNGGLDLAGCDTGDCVIQVADSEIDLDMLTAAVSARLLPTSPTDNQIARYDLGTTAWVAEDLPAGTGGGADLTGNTIEVLYDNMDAGDTALTVASGSPNWARTIDLDLGRALVAADDDKDLRVRFHYDQVTNRRTVDFMMNAGEFRQWTEFTTTTGTSPLPVGNMRFSTVIGESGDNNLGAIWNRQGMVFRRGDSSGNFVMGLILETGGGGTKLAVSNFRAKVELVPRVDALMVSGGGGMGSGDITAVTTAATSGLAGGADSGDVALTVDLDGLTTGTTYATGDKVPFVDVSGTGDPTITTTFGELFTAVAGDNLTWDAANFELDASGGGTADGVINGLTATYTSENLTITASRSVGSTLTASANIAAPASWALNTSPTGQAPVARLGTGTASATTFLRGDGTWATPSSSAGDITAVTTGTTSGLAGGATSGDVALTFDPDNLPVVTSLEDDDTLIFVDESASGDPPLGVTARNFFESFDGDNLSWDATNDELDVQLVANPGGSGLTELETITIGSTSYIVHPGMNVYLAGTAAYDTTNDRLTVTASQATDIDLGDAVLFALPSDIDTATDALDLRVEFGSDNETNPLLNADLTPVLAAELAPNLVLEAFLLLVNSGTNRRWVLIEPTDLTTAQAQSTTDTHFGLVSGNRLSEAIAPWARFSPSGISADDCLKGNSAGTAMEFGTCGTGGGGGDLTAVDAGDGIRVDDGTTATPEVNLDISRLSVASGAMQGSDEIAIADDSQTGDSSRKVTLSTYAAHLAGGDTLIGFNSSGQLTFDGTQNTGDITAVTTAATSGLAGGATSGDVALTVDLDGLPSNRTVIAATDRLAVVIDGLVGDPTYTVPWTEVVDELGDDGRGINADNAGVLELDFEELSVVATSATPALTDAFAYYDASDTTYEASRYSVQEWLNDTAGVGLGRTTGGTTYELTLNELAIDNTYAAGDELIFRDVSDTTDDSRITMQNFCNRLAAADTNMSCNTNAQLQYSAAAFGGLTIQDDGSELGTGVTTLDFDGVVTVAVSGTQADIDLPNVNDRSGELTISNADQFLMWDASEGAENKVSGSTLGAYIRTGTGTIISVTGEDGIVTSTAAGAVTVGLDIDSLPGISTLDGSDTIPIEDETDSAQSHTSIDTLGEHFAGGANLGLDSNDSGRLILDANDLTAVTSVASGDFLAVVDVAGPDAGETDDDGHTRKITIANFVNDTAGTGIDRDGENYRLDIDELTTQTSLQGTDEFAFGDDSQTNNASSNATLATIAAHLAGASSFLGANSTGQITTTGIGDITGITTNSTSGMSGGATSGTPSLKVNPRYMTTRTDLDVNDYVLMGTGNLTETPVKVTVTNLMNIVDGSGLHQSSGQLALDYAGSSVAGLRYDTSSGDSDSILRGLRISFESLTGHEHFNGNARIPIGISGSTGAPVGVVSGTTFIEQLTGDVTNGNGGSGGLINGASSANNAPFLVVDFDDGADAETTAADGDYFGFTDVSETNDDDRLKGITFENLKAALGGRTAIYTVGSSGEWTNSGGVKSVTVTDIDNYEYITISLWAAPSAGLPQKVETVTFLRSELDEDATPTTGEERLTLSIDGFDIPLGRNSAGTTFYWNPGLTGSNTDTGKIMGIWGGSF